MKDGFEQIFILGVRVDVVRLDELLAYISSIIRDEKKAVIAYVNVHAMNVAQDLRWFRDFINRSQVAFCDGFGVKWAVRFLTGKRIQRFTPPDWFGQLADICARQGFSMFFLGTQQVTV